MARKSIISSIFGSLYGFCLTKAETYSFLSLNHKVIWLPWLPLGFIFGGVWTESSTNFCKQIPDTIRFYKWYLNPYLYELLFCQYWMLDLMCQEHSANSCHTELKVHTDIITLYWHYNSHRCISMCACKQKKMSYFHHVFYNIFLELDGNSPTSSCFTDSKYSENSSGCKSIFINSFSFANILEIWSKFPLILDGNPAKKISLKRALLSSSSPYTLSSLVVCLLDHQTKK